MMYKVIKFFTDLNDNNHPYNVGEIFPRLGVTATEKRLAELAGSNNKQGVPLISPVEAEKAEPARKSPAKKSAKKTAQK